MKKRVVVILCSLFFGLSLQAQVTPRDHWNLLIYPPKEMPAPVVESSIPPHTSASQRDEIDPQLAAAFQEIVDTYLEDNDYIGLSAAVNIGGEIWAGSAGNSTVSISVNPDMLFAIGSVTKTLTAACILDMAEDNLLNIDDPIGDYIDDYDNVDPTITIRQLMSHTSGIYDYTNNLALGDSINADLSRIWTPQEIIEGFVLAPIFEQGTDWGYSNTNFLLLGLVIESASNNTYHTEIRQRFLVPLGLENITLGAYETNSTYDIAHLWFDLFNTGNPLDFQGLNLSTNGLFSAAWSAGGYLARPTDISIWMRALQSGEVLEAASLAEMRNSIPFPAAAYPLLGAGLGTFNQAFECDDVDGWGHGGDIIYSSQVFYNDEDDISIAVHSNDGTQDSDDLTELVNDLHCAFINFVPVSTENPLDRELQFSLAPNPAVNGHTTISWTLPQSEQVQLRIYNELGQLVAQPVNAVYPAGTQQFDWFSDHSAGIYIISLQIDDQIYHQKLVQH